MDAFRPDDSGWLRNCRLVSPHRVSPKRKYNPEPRWIGISDLSEKFLGKNKKFFCKSLNKRSQGAADCGKRDGDAYFTYARRPDRRKMRCPVSAYGMAASSSAVIFRTKIWWLALSK